MAQPGSSEVERRLPGWECANDARAPPDLAQNTLERIVRSNAPPVWPGLDRHPDCFTAP
jgi:hypothetical protein